MANNNAPCITVVGHKDEGALLGKRYFLVDGELEAETGAALSDGFAVRASLNSGKPHTELLALRSNLHNGEALVAGQYARHLPDRMKLTNNGRQDGKTSIARTRQDLPWPVDTPGVLVVDCDGGDSTAAPHDRSALFAQLEKAAPGITAAGLCAPSSSAGIMDIASGKLLKPINRWHFYRLVADASDIPRTLETMFIRLYLAGHGWLLITRAAVLLPRTAVDRALRISCQPIFTPKPLGDGLRYQAEEPWVIEGELFDTRAAIPPLAEEERQDYAVAVERNKKRMRKSHKTLLQDIIRARCDSVAKSRKVSVTTAREIIKRQTGETGDQRFTGSLVGRDEVVLDSGEWVNINTILSEPGKYHGMGCHDPLEPDYGSGKAIIYTDTTPCIHSLAHGASNTYSMHMDPEGLFAHLQQLQAAEATEALKAGREADNIIADVWAEYAARLLPPGVDREMRNLVLPHVSDGARVLDDELKRARKSYRAREQKQTEHRAQEGFKKKARYEGRKLVYYDPDNPNEAIAACQERLGDTRRPDPVFENERRAVVVRTKLMPFDALAPKDNPDVVLFSALTLEDVKLHLNDRCSFLKKGPKGWRATAAPHELALSIWKQSDTGLPVASQILEHPVFVTGTIFSSPGYNSRLKMYLNTGDLNASALPRQGVKKPDAEEALKWLRDVFFDEFPFRPAHCEHFYVDVAIAAALTRMQRAVLPEAPGCIIDAPQQSVGKTAIVQAISCAMTGRGIPTSSMPSTDEEVDKRITSVSTTGRTDLLFDNIAKGRVLDSETMAAFMTAKYGHSGRILGESKMIDGLSRLMLWMTGINITTKGDFNSRFLRVRLMPLDRNPEMRTYRRDIETWAVAHRSKFLRALLTIQLAYRGESTVADFRMKQWDTQVRKPLVWAGGADVTQVFLLNSEDDSELMLGEQLLGALHTVLGESIWHVGDFLEAVDDCQYKGPFAEAEEARSVLEGAFRELRSMTLLNSITLSLMLRTMKDRWYGKYRLSAGKKGKRGVRWHIDFSK